MNHLKARDLGLVSDEVVGAERQLLPDETEPFIKGVRLALGWKETSRIIIVNLRDKAQPTLLWLENLLSLAAEMTDGDVLTNEAVTSHLEVEYGHGKGPNSPESMRRGALEEPRPGSRLLSGPVAVNALCLGTALISAGAFSEVPVGHTEVLISLTVVMGLVVGWMLFYVLCTARQKGVIVSEDPHAGPVWLRGMKEQLL
ncbi:hypothetical protein chiPu_0021583 [Chiloscyllium punctatum]|uniref:Uncharacterized protein n=1 Tax=Chiloscyllium punctatum TaxID=137246 RepID=A0A401RI51_CHIPU|nr:hypothetical protein [Chiloscyllium punctatum]